MNTPEEREMVEFISKLPPVNLAANSRHERRVRSLWSAEPQRGAWSPQDDDARGQLALDAERLSLDYWATIQAANYAMPADQGDFVHTAQWFGILGISIVAFPTAELRDAFVAANPDGAQAVPDDAFWP